MFTRRRNTAANSEHDDDVQADKKGSSPPAHLNRLFGSARRLQKDASSVSKVTKDEDSSDEKTSSRSSNHRHSASRRSVSNVDVPADDSTWTVFNVYVDKADKLRAADRGGTSDPFASFRIKDVSKFKTKKIKKTLKPQWRENGMLECPGSLASLVAQDIKIDIQVFDWDRFGKNDLLGEASINLRSLRLGKATPLELKLFYHEKEEGVLFVTVTPEREVRAEPVGTLSGTKVWGGIRGAQNRLVTAANPLAAAVARGANKLAKNESTISALSNASGADTEVLVVVEVVEAKNLPAMDKDGTSDPYVKVKVGKISHKTKVKNNTLTPIWKQSFEFTVTDSSVREVELNLWDKDFLAKSDFMGQAAIKLNTLMEGQTTDIWVPLLADKRGNGGGGEIHVLVTISDLRKDVELHEAQREKHVGSLMVHVVRAVDLEAKDRGGTSDPYVDVRLGNAYVRTIARKKTLNPEWDKLLEMPVHDVFGCVELTVFDEDKGGKADFLGRLSVPLLDIKNDSLQWFVLKSKDVMKPAQGEILLSFHYDYKLVPGVMQLIARPTVVHMDRHDKFRQSLLWLHKRRLETLFNNVNSGITFVNKTFKWEYGDQHTIIAIIIFILGCLFLCAWHIPLLMLGYVTSRHPKAIRLRKTGDFRELLSHANGERIRAHTDDQGRTVDGGTSGSVIANAYSGEMGEEPESDGSDSDSDDEDEDGKEKVKAASASPKKKKKVGFIGKLRGAERTAANVQNKMDGFASLGESVNNLTNWSVPLASRAMCLGLFVGSMVLIVIPYNYVIMAGGLRKFFKSWSKRRNMRNYFAKHNRPMPMLKPYNPGFAILSRIPSDVDKEKYRQLPSSMPNVDGRGPLLKDLRSDKKKIRRESSLMRDMKLE